MPAAAVAVRLGALRCAPLRKQPRLLSRFLSVMQSVLDLPVRMHVKSQDQAQNGNSMIKNDGFVLDFLAA